MRHFLRNLLPGYKILLGIMLLSSAGVAFATSEDAANALVKQNSNRVASKSSWAIAFDNDVLVPGSRDQDYTYGINLSFAGNRVENHWASLHQPLGWINNFIRLDGQIGQGTKASKIEYGLFGFTPEDITLSEAQQDDRPYASLIYVSSSLESYDRRREVSW